MSLKVDIRRFGKRENATKRIEEAKRKQQSPKKGVPSGVRAKVGIEELVVKPSVDSNGRVDWKKIGHCKKVRRMRSTAMFDAGTVIKSRKNVKNVVVDYFQSLMDSAYT